MKNRYTSVAELCKELKITRATLYKYIFPEGELRDYGKRVLNTPLLKDMDNELII